MFDLNAYLSSKQETVNTKLNEILDSFNGSSRILESMRYSLNAGGKRIRPILSIAAAEAVGANESNVILIACAIEMIHTYSLIHDDLPAMDNDDLRRGMPTSHIQFDEATAILAGDALLTLAFEILSSPDISKKNPAATYLEIIKLLAKASGCQGMIEGQMGDILSEGKELSLRELESIHLLKTGALIEASVHAGAIIGKGNEEEVDMLRTYGKQIGLAFQIMDDILNIKGDPSLMGKAVGSDAKRGKNTYPAIIGLKRSEKYAFQLIQTGLHALHGFDNKADPLRAIGKYIIERTR
jgi:geranylgeranyl diphosphate synthase type II